MKAPLIVLVVASVSLLLGDETEEKRNTTSKLAINIAEFVVVDQETGSPLNATLGFNKSISEERDLGDHLFEMKPNGPYRITWVDEGNKDWVLTIRVEGYITRKIDKDTRFKRKFPLMERYQGQSVIGGRVGTITIHLVPDPEAAQNKASHSSPDRPESK